MAFRVRSTFVLYPFLTVILALPLTGCRAKIIVPRNPAIDAAMVPDADVVIRCDIISMRQSPAGKMIEHLKAEREKSNPALAEKSAQQVEIEKATGLTQEDITAILASASLAGTNFKDATGAALASQISAVLAVEFSKPLSLDQLRAAAKVISSDTPDAISEAKLDGVAALVIKSNNANEPPICAATSTDGKTLYLTVSESSLKDALARHHQDKPAIPSPALSAAEDRLPADSQLKVVFIAPDAVRQAIKEKIDSSQNSGGPGAAMIINMVKPFQNLQNVSIHAQMATDAVFNLSAELGSAQDAAQVALLVPLLQRMIPQKQAAGMPDLSTALSFTNSGPVITLSLRLTQQDIVMMNHAAPSPTHAAPPNLRPRTGPAIPAPAEAPATVVPPPAAPHAAATPAVTAVPAQRQAPTAVTAPPPPASTEKQDWIDAKKKIKFTGAVKGKNGKWMAMIDNDLVEEGATVSVRHQQMLYRWKVSAIIKDGVTFDQLDRQPQK